MPDIRLASPLGSTRINPLSVAPWHRKAQKETASGGLFLSFYFYASGLQGNSRQGGRRSGVTSGMEWGQIGKLASWPMSVPVAS